MVNFKEYLQRPFVQRILLLIAIGVVIYFMRSLMTLFLLTFIFVYLINSAQKKIYQLINRFIPIRRSIIIVAIYLIFIGLIVAVIWIYAPKVVQEAINVLSSVTTSLKELANYKTNNDTLNYIISKITSIDVTKYVDSGSKYLINMITIVGNLGVNFLMAIILSLFFMLGKSSIIKFFLKFKDSKVSWLYNEVGYFGSKFMNTFGKVIQTQILISFINSLISVLILSILHFPNVLGLWIMIFILGLIPVAGVFISLVPLCVLAYGQGGLQTIIYMLILIAVLHALESYILNPKLMSDKTKLPVFVTFLVLIISEHFLGIWGLIVGIPITVFLLDILDVKTSA